MLPRKYSLPPLCPAAERFRETVELSIFQQLTPATTPAQYAAALAYLTALKTEKEQGLSRFHFGTASGFHSCISHVYETARDRITFLSLLHPVLPEPKAPKPAPPALEAVVKRFEQTTETYLSKKEEDNT